MNEQSAVKIAMWWAGRAEGDEQIATATTASVAAVASYWGCRHLELLQKAGWRRHVDQIEPRTVEHHRERSDYDSDKKLDDAAALMRFRSAPDELSLRIAAGSSATRPLSYCIVQHPAIERTVSSTLGLLSRLKDIWEPSFALVCPIGWTDEVPSIVHFGWYTFAPSLSDGRIDGLRRIQAFWALPGLNDDVSLIAADSTEVRETAIELTRRHVELLPTLG